MAPRPATLAVLLLAFGCGAGATVLAQTPPAPPLSAPRGDRPSYVYDGDGRLVGTARPGAGDDVLLYGTDGRFIGAARRRGRDLYLYDRDGRVTDTIRPRERVVLRRGPGDDLGEVGREPARSSYDGAGDRLETRRAPRPFPPQRQVDRLDFGERAGGVGRRSPVPDR